MKIGSEVFDIEGVKNVYGVSINNGKDFLSYFLNDNEIPVVGIVFISASSNRKPALGH